LKNTSRAVSVSYLGPSVTTFNNLNPGYRIYTVDGVYNDSSFNILDHETIFMNLTEANLNDNPKWEKEYSAKVSIPILN
jgi:sphingomyelin phosphodiesterase